jgi:hypothetical protein
MDIATSMHFKRQEFGPHLPPGMYYQQHCNCSWWLNSALHLESRTIQRSQEQSFIFSSRDANV